MARGREEPLATAAGGMRRTARVLLDRAGGAANSLGSLDLVGEALVRLLRDRRVREHPDPRYLRGAWLRSMRRVLVDRLRRRKALKRGGGLRRSPLGEAAERAAIRNARSTFHDWEFDDRDVRDSLARLEGDHDRAASCVRSFYFEGLPVPEIARSLGVSTSTVEKDLGYGRAWMRGDLTRHARGMASPPPSRARA